MSELNRVFCPVCFREAPDVEPIAICDTCGADVEVSGGWVEAETWNVVFDQVVAITTLARESGSKRHLNAVEGAVAGAIVKRNQKDALKIRIALVNELRRLDAELNSILAACNDCRHKDTCEKALEKREVCLGIGPRWDGSRAHNASVLETGRCVIPNCKDCAEAVASPDSGEKREHHDDPCGGRLCSECEIAMCDGPTLDEAAAESLLEVLIGDDTVEFFLTRLVESVGLDEIAGGLLAGLSPWGRDELSKRLALDESTVDRASGGARGTTSEKPSGRA